jgi:5'-nucleotidase / UDP-sugar diphosphatase
MRNYILFLALTLGLFSCDTPKKATSAAGKDDSIIEVVFLQMNDVYEISPTAYDNVGGLARVATIRKNLMASNPNTITVLAGDFISPSIIGTLRYEGKRIRGKQVVETMNALGLDYVVFGNHEFDYDDQADLQARLDESNFTWFGANARLKNAAGASVPFYKNKNGATEECPDYKSITLKDADGTTLKLGMFGVLINTGRKPWVEYTDHTEASKKAIEALRPQSDVIVGLTHLAVEEDKKLAGSLSDITLIMGGHEHENQIHKVGNCTITKADANAKTVYVHTLRYDTRSKTSTLRSELKQVDAKIADEPATAAVVAKWEKIKSEALATSGFDPNAKVTTFTEPLDCREVALRYRQCSAGEIINDAMIAAARNKPDCSFFNSGSVRVDDVLSGTITELDIVRTLPFGGSVVEVEMRGNLLRKTLGVGQINRGNGGFLQYRKVRKEEASGTWLIGDNKLDDAKIYRVILPEFLLSGAEQNMGFLKTSANADGKGTTNPDILSLQKPDPKDKTDLRNDIRFAVIAFLRK